MGSVGVRELRQHASRVLARVEGGEIVEITNRGRVVARLVPPGPRRRTREDLIAEGVLIAGNGENPLEVPRVDLPEGVTTTALLEELRAERL